MYQILNEGGMVISWAFTRTQGTQVSESQVCRRIFTVFVFFYIIKYLKNFLVRKMSLNYALGLLMYSCRFCS